MWTLCIWTTVKRLTRMIKLIEKLFNINIDWKMIKLISSFLQDRKMRVQVKLSFSDWVAVLSEVPQGSVMGSLLFFDIHKRFASVDPQQQDIDVC